MAENTLCFGDNLDILRRYVKSESVDLIYLDPPFKSEQDYNILFAEQNGSRAAAQIKAFEDTWQWDQASAAAYQEIVEAGPPRVSQVMRAEAASAGFYKVALGKARKIVDSDNRGVVEGKDDRLPRYSRSKCNVQESPKSQERKGRASKVRLYGR